MNDFTRLIASLKRDQKRTGTDYTGTVTKVDGGTAYVRLTGSQISDTPCALTISANVGDRVRVRVSGGRAWVTGNDTAPPTNDTEDIAVVKTENSALIERNRMLENRLNEVPYILSGDIGGAMTIEPGATGGAIGTFGPEFLTPPNFFTELQTSNSSPQIGRVTVSTESVDTRGYKISIHNASSIAVFVLVRWVAIGRLKR
jgi:hypothetical protein